MSGLIIFASLNNIFIAINIFNLIMDIQLDEDDMRVLEENNISLEKFKKATQYLPPDDVIFLIKTRDNPPHEMNKMFQKHDERIRKIRKMMDISPIFKYFSSIDFRYYFTL